MRGFAVFFSLCLTVAVLMVIPPPQARWVALALLGLLYVVSALPRRRVER